MRAGPDLPSPSENIAPGVATAAAAAGIAGGGPGGAAAAAPAGLVVVVACASALESAALAAGARAADEEESSRAGASLITGGCDGYPAALGRVLSLSPAPAAILVLGALRSAADSARGALPQASSMTGR
jgi:hypothetical protein